MNFVSGPLLKLNLCWISESKIIGTKFIGRGFHEKEFKKIIKQVAKKDRNELLGDQTL